MQTQSERMNTLRERVLDRNPVLPAALLLAGSFALLYWRVIARLVHDWVADGNYSHGFLIVPLSVYFAWERRARLRTIPRQPSGFGLVVVIGSVAVLLAGLMGAELFLTRVSLIGIIAGAILFLFGWRTLRVLTLPVLFLLLMIPIPAIILNQITFPLQLLASQVGESSLRALDVPVLREGNVIVLANVSLEVAEACSGIRSLISLLTLGIVYGYFVDPRLTVRLAVALSTIPIAIAANGIRVAGTGVAAHYWGPQVAEGFFHTFSGWLMFVVAFCMLFVVTKIIVRVAPRPSRDILPESIVAVRG
jgi:exosortase